jgi:hypothetical protein
MTEFDFLGASEMEDVLNLSEACNIQELPIILQVLIDKNWNSH